MQRHDDKCDNAHSCGTILTRLNERAFIGHKPSTNLNELAFIGQTKATGKLTQLSTTFMFTPKVNSKQKRVKKMQEHKTGYAVTEQFR
ncbi:hypothetical protein MTR_7g014415 [Medicago truncatula]|uniref:Uncharacterized protein n=1 Tax=Medicago truncatula TaxID=3880 RepID=A0A072TVY6_MEDTR|nr:hypothetical protein MTR_7g014415 [Medicago truncatula]